MKVFSATPAKSPVIPCSRRAAMASLALTAVTAPAFSALRAGTSQDATLAVLVKLREDWVTALHTKQLEPILQFYAADAAFLQPSGERISGAAALRNLFQTIMTTFNSDLILHSLNLETSGDLAYDSGDFAENLTNIASGAKIASKGSYVIIYRRQTNGNWHIVQHVWTGIPPAGT
jgi:ketosteroid isomerase-like protein